MKKVKWQYTYCPACKLWVYLRWSNAIGGWQHKVCGFVLKQEILDWEGNYIDRKIEFAILEADLATEREVADTSLQPN